MDIVTGDPAYYKFQADYLFDGSQLFDDGRVLITDEEGMIMDLVPVADAGGDIQTFQGMLSPGFINCHCHLELSHLLGKIPEKTGLIGFIQSVMSLRQADDADILDAITLAESQMVQDGIVAVGDICNTRFTLTQKEKQRLSYYNFIELTGWLPAQAPVRFQAGRELYEAFEKSSHGESQTSLNPHAPYSVSAPLWKLMQEFFSGKTVSLHNQESAAENELFLNGSGGFRDLYDQMKIQNALFEATGTSSLQAVFNELQAAKNVMLVHNTFTSPADLDLINRSGAEVFLCLCPNANLYIEDRLPAVDILQGANVTMVLGTDSLASNKQLDILSEIKILRERFPTISQTSMLQWATSNGARALQLQEELGTFQVEKKPGIVLIDALSGENITEASRSVRLL